MTKAVLGVIGGSGIYDLPGLENVREERIASPWASRRGRCGSARSLACRWCSCRATTKASAVALRHQLSRQYRCTQARRRHRSRFAVGLRLVQGATAAAAPSCWSTSSSTAPTSARARSSARGWSRMFRWRIRCRRGSASISPRPRSREHRGGARPALCLHGGPQFSTLARA